MRVLIPALLAACLVGCDDDVHGTYRLASVEGEALPFEVNAFLETDWLITEGELRVTGDSVVWIEDFEAPTGDEGLHFAYASAYTREGSTLRAQPESFDPDPDDEFFFCAIGGVYHVEDGGDRLRLVDMVVDGDCGSELDPYYTLERVYRRE
jgi:hypothetical protein